MVTSKATKSTVQRNAPTATSTTTDAPNPKRETTVPPTVEDD